MAIDIQMIPTEEKHRPLEEIVNGNGDNSLSYLDGLRTATSPRVKALVDRLKGSHGLISEINHKSSESAIEKCRRPSTISRYPWFGLPHIRDYLRFRTLLNHASDFERVIRFFDQLQDQREISIVKIDAAKMIRPGVFGWRMVAVDIRVLSTGMLVEHYMTFRNMIEVNDIWLHKLYEVWRSVRQDDLSVQDLAARERDTSFSRHAYRELLLDGILRAQPDALHTIQRRHLSNAIIGDLKSSLNIT